MFTTIPMPTLLPVTAATTEPVDAAFVKQHLRIDGTASDAWLTIAITAARLHVEHLTGRTIARARYKLLSSSWYALNNSGQEAGPLQLRRGPVESANDIVQVQYRNATDGSLTTLSDTTLWELRTDVSGRSYFAKAFGKTFPTLTSTYAIDRVQVTYDAGPPSGQPTAVDVRLRMGIAQLIGFWFERREPTNFEVPEAQNNALRQMLWALCVD